MSKTYLCFLGVFVFCLSACGTGATVGVGGGGGSYGGGGGIGISFPVGGDSGGQYEQGQPKQAEPGTQEGEEAEHDSESVGVAGPNYIGSNLGSPYPKPNCYQPMKPDRGDSSGSYMIYKQQLDKYRICVDTYVKNAKNDMIDIENKANSALREYRQFVTMP